MDDKVIVNIQLNNISPKNLSKIYTTNYISMLKDKYCLRPSQV
jgi:hypothetical protein